MTMLGKTLLTVVVGTILSAVFIYSGTSYVDAKHQDAMGRIAINNIWIKETREEMSEIKLDVRDIHRHYFPKYRDKK